MKKRIVLLTAVLLSLSVLGMAQNSGTYTAKKTSTKTVKKTSTKTEKTYQYKPQFEKGWNLRPEIGIGFPLKLEFLLSAGYQINPYLILGLGTGVGSFHPGDSYYSNAPFWYTTYFPLYATFRVNFLTTKHGFTPFFETKMGYSFGLLGDDQGILINYDMTTIFSGQANPSGFYGHWGIGLNCYNFDLLLSYHVLGSWKWEFDWNYGDRYFDYYNHHFSISIAYNIPFKKKSQE